MGGDQRAGSPLRPECSRGTWPVGHGGQLRRMRIRNSGISAISMCAGDRRADVSDRKIRARPRPHAPPGGASRAPHFSLFIRGLWSAQPQGLRVRLGLGLGIVAPEGRVAARDRSGSYELTLVPDAGDRGAGGWPRAGRAYIRTTVTVLRATLIIKPSCADAHGCNTSLNPAPRLPPEPALGPRHTRVEFAPHLHGV